MALRRASVYARCMSRRLQCAAAPLHTSTIPALSISAISTQDNATSVSKKPMSLQDIEALLNSEPTWSVESLLPPEKNLNGDTSDVPRVSAKQLHHLLRLSALPPPKSQEQEAKMLSTLSDQLHFVGRMQQVDTSGVKPLRAIRDETAAAEQEQTITLETLKDALSKERVIGKHYKRIQRDTTAVDASNVETWDVLGSAERKQGKYFVVESERPQE
ncbi:hypothetical protein BU23DRAFT_329014 [Bimuria novae-zelandiae CBS 107.79]|uniref:Glutamyl-tRNA amidotransferase complex subunit Gta3 domain-containing protein n=1 Tax=Bimuria novae-zelandiae CBS 107.79 TaxID=1447943 RepID=A0A6A5UPA6_9PLEO|nr:hypothetical protein BU23DRAFT_329014 [Bimuria novae-zelandiae CBS 107.79]